MELQRELFGDAPATVAVVAAKPMRFDGATYDPERDCVRLTGQYLRIWNVMSDGLFRTLSAIAKETGDPEASISARLRDFRKERFGSHEIEREYLGSGLYQYKLIVNKGNRE
jgi:hypothetical protein